MNTYDPMDRIVYRHLDQGHSPGAVPMPTANGTSRLPADYANRSPRTYLGRARRPSQAA